MSTERTMDGLEIRLRSGGAGRWFGASFLLFWLCGWAAGEAFALGFLIKGAIALLTGRPPEPGRELLHWGPALAIGAFLLFWLTLWTFGGIAAMSEFLRLVWGDDRLLAHGGGLRVVHRRGPFGSSREIARDAILGIELLRRNGRLVAETRKGTVALSALGTPQEREEAVEALRRELGLSDAVAGAIGSSEPATLPPGWEDTITPEGERALVPSAATRHTQARVASVVAMVAAVVTSFAVRGALSAPGLWGPAVMGLLFTTAIAWGAVWLARGRMEWRIGSGRITLRRRFGSSVSDVFTAQRLELTSTTDSDGDEWIRLAALGEPTGDPAMTSTAPRHRTIARTMNDGSVPRRLGAWLAAAADVPLDDRTTQRAQAADLAELRRQLEGSGRLGQLAARWIDRLEAKRPGGG